MLRDIRIPKLLLYTRPPCIPTHNFLLNPSTVLLLVHLLLPLPLKNGHVRCSTVLKNKCIFLSPMMWLIFTLRGIKNKSDIYKLILQGYLTSFLHHNKNLFELLDVLLVLAQTGSLRPMLAAY
jgi:hypothetical protein